MISGIFWSPPILSEISEHFGIKSLCFANSSQQIASDKVIAALCGSQGELISKLKECGDRVYGQVELVDQLVADIPGTSKLRKLKYFIQTFLWVFMPLVWVWSRLKYSTNCFHSAIVKYHPRIDRVACLLEMHDHLGDM